MRSNAEISKMLSAVSAHAPNERQAEAVNDFWDSLGYQVNAHVIAVNKVDKAGRQYVHYYQVRSDLVDGLPPDYRGDGRDIEEEFSRRLADWISYKNRKQNR